MRINPIVWIAAVVGAATASHAAEDPWQLSLRGAYLAPANHSDPIAGIAPSDTFHIDGKWFPDLGIDYFFTPHWSGEFELTYPLTHDAALNGQPIGTFKLLPPALTAKYHWFPDRALRPYLGAGLSVASISNVDLELAGVGHLDLDSSSVGPALQAGLDYHVTERWFVNVDAKWFVLRSDIESAAGNRISTVRIDPFLFGVGFAYRFGAEDVASAKAPVPASSPTRPEP